MQRGCRNRTVYGSEIFSANTGNKIIIFKQFLIGLLMERLNIFKQFCVVVFLCARIMLRDVTEVGWSVFFMYNDRH